MSAKLLVQDAGCTKQTLWQFVYLPQRVLGLALCCHLVALWYHP